MPNGAGRFITQCGILAVIAIVIIWDIYVAVSMPNQGATVSEVSLNFLWRHPVAPFALGGVVGHVMWPSRGASGAGRTTVFILAATVIALVVTDALRLVPLVTPIAPFLCGIPYGRFMWPQGEEQKPEIYI